MYNQKMEASEMEPCYYTFMPDTGGWVQMTKKGFTDFYGWMYYLPESCEGYKTLIVIPPPEAKQIDDRSPSDIAGD